MAAKCRRHARRLPVKVDHDMFSDLLFTHHILQAHTVADGGSRFAGTCILRHHQVGADVVNLLRAKSSIREAK